MGDDPLLRERNETPLQRCDRNLVELLAEVRVVQTGVQVLFGFLLMAPLSDRFDALGSLQRSVYFVTLVATGAAAMLLTAPTAYHRILFRCGDKENVVTVANRYTLAGLTCVAVSLLGALLFVVSMLFDAAVTVLTVGLAAVALVWCWGVAPLLRRRQIARGAGGALLALRGARRLSP